MMLVEYQVNFERLRHKTSNQTNQSWSELAQLQYNQLAARQRPGWAANFLQHAYEWSDLHSPEVEDILRIAQHPQAGYWFHASEVELVADSSSPVTKPLSNLAATVRDITCHTYLAVAAEIFYLPANNQLHFATHLHGQRLGHDLRELAVQLDSKLFNKQICSLLSA